jgi:signal transduction histidine kinase
VALDLDLGAADAADGARRVHLELYPLPDTTPPRWAALVSDERERSAVERDYRLSTLMRSLAWLNAAVAHDLKSPLAAAMLHLELIKTTIGAEEKDPTGERRQRYVRVMKDELGRLNLAITTLFQQMTLRRPRERFDLLDLVGDIEFLIAPQAKRQGVSIEKAMPADKLEVEADRDALSQAVLNVAVNALEAMASGGHLGLELARHDGAARLTVADTGAGIAPEIAPRIFEPRFTTKPHGVGLGLYVSRAVLHLHDGNIRAEGNPGGGTRLVLVLPLPPQD